MSVDIVEVNVSADRALSKLMCIRGQSIVEATVCP